MVAGPDVHRAAGWGWRRATLAFIASASLAGAALGGATAVLGTHLSMEVRAGALLVLSACAIGVGLLEASGRVVPVLQCDRETPRRWLRAARAGAVKNGLALGCGLTTRIGFWSYFAVPIGALLSGNVPVGVLIGASYGVVRSGAVGAWLVANVRGGGDDATARWMLGHAALARRIGGAWLALVGVFLLGLAW